MNTLENHLQKIEQQLGSNVNDIPPYNEPDKLGWHLNKIEDLLEQGGGGGGGTTVIANPEMSGEEDDLVGLQVGNIKYKISGEGGGSSYKGVTILETGTWINDGEESQTLYVFNIWSDNPIEGAEDYWGFGDEEKSYLLMHHLSNEEFVLTPVILSSIPDHDSETGGYIYSIQVQGQLVSPLITFSSVEVQHGNVIEALLDNVEDFEDLEHYLKANSLIKSSSDEIIVASGTSDEDAFTLAIQAPESIPNNAAFNTYLESAKNILWIDGDAIGTGTVAIYLTPCKIDIDNLQFRLMPGNVNFNEWYIKRRTAFFNFDPEVKESFIQGSIGGGSGGGSGGPNYQQPYSGTYGRDWYARIVAETEPNITIKNLEVDENYMLLRLTYQEISEEITPIETKVFSIINIGEGIIDSYHKTYYVVWNIENMHYILKDGENPNPIQTDSYLRYYPNIIGFAPEPME